MTVEPGRLIGDRYRIERTLGSGAMGVVVAARHVALDELVALKFMRAELRQDSEMTRRFAREAKAAAKIRSDHVATVLDVGTDDQLGPYIAMELLEGHDLAEVLQRGRLPSPIACGYVLQACEGLALAHALGIVHRDLKPSNLYLTHRGDLEVVKVLDFGVSKAALSGVLFGGEMSAADTSHMLGSPLYMSPEQIRAITAIDHRSDIWSLGVVLYELISGRSPFDAESIADVCTRILEGSATPLAASGLHDAGELEVIIRRCLSKEPKDRYADVGALAQAIAPFAPSRFRLHSVRTQSVLRHHRIDGQVDVRESGMFSSTLSTDHVVSDRADVPAPGTPSDKVITMPDSSNTVDSAPAFRSSKRPLFWWLGAAAVVASGFWFLSQNPESEVTVNAAVSTTSVLKPEIPAPEVVSAVSPGDEPPPAPNASAWSISQTQQVVTGVVPAPVPPFKLDPNNPVAKRFPWKRNVVTQPEPIPAPAEAQAKPLSMERDSNLPVAQEAPAAPNEPSSKSAAKNRLRLVNDRPLKLVD